MEPQCSLPLPQGSATGPFLVPSSYTDLLICISVEFYHPCLCLYCGVFLSASATNIVCAVPMSHMRTTCPDTVYQMFCGRPTISCYINIRYVSAKFASVGSKIPLFCNTLTWNVLHKNRRPEGKSGHRLFALSEYSNNPYSFFYHVHYYLITQRYSRCDSGGPIYQI
jgi:hypothetical protein